MRKVYTIVYEDGTRTSIEAAGMNVDEHGVTFYAPAKGEVGQTRSWIMGASEPVLHLSHDVVLEVANRTTLGLVSMDEQPECNCEWPAEACNYCEPSEGDEMRGISGALRGIADLIDGSETIKPFKGSIENQLDCQRIRYQKGKDRFGWAL